MCEPFPSLYEVSCPMCVHLGITEAPAYAVEPEAGDTHG